VAQRIDDSIEAWSDDQLLDAYRSVTNDASDTTHEERLAASLITEEMKRRGLPFPDTPAEVLQSETVDWSEGKAVLDAGSGALPPDLPPR
jgi:hypothetical protein